LRLIKEMWIYKVCIRIWNSVGNYGLLGFYGI
jgi:hypothetical protein